MLPVRRLGLVLALALLPALVGCSDSSSEECVEGQTGSCWCADGRPGITTCELAGTWGVCSCVKEGDVRWQDVSAELPAPEDTRADEAGADSTTIDSRYIFVRIDDLSPFAETPDGGADIDAVILQKPNGAFFFASDVQAYEHGGGLGILVDPIEALGAPDAFHAWPDTSVCQIEGFVSLGGLGGVIVLRMEEVIDMGDVLTVLEVGGCEHAGGEAIAEEVEVHISVSSDPWGGHWMSLGGGEGPEIVFSIPDLPSLP